MSILKPKNDFSPCAACLYKLGMVKTLINPCPQCKAGGYKEFYRLQKEKSSNLNNFKKN